MINLRGAFGAQTTTTVKVHLEIVGYYDDNNRWVPSGYGRGIPIICTPLPLGDQDHGTYGESLKAEEIGERTPAGMKFSSPFRLPINAVLSHNGQQYKITREGDYSAAGFWAAVGFTDTTAQPIDVSQPLEYPDGMTITKGAVEIPVARILEAYSGRC